MVKKKQSEKQVQRDRLKNLYPDAVTFMENALRDKLKDAKGKKVVATIGQKLDIAQMVVNQVVGRPAQAPVLSANDDRPTVKTLEVTKVYDSVDEIPNNTDGLIPVEEELLVGPADREEWLKTVEEEALGGSELPGDTDGSETTSVPFFIDEGVP
jgi:hypothetical protein